MTNLTGQTLDRYRLLARLGEGGMGSVYKAHDAMLLRDVAVKVMHARFGRQARFRERFLREAQAAARLIHPGLVKVYDFGQADERLFIVMEFIPGGNLRQRLLALRADHRRLKLDEAVSVARCVAEALHRLHGHGVLHRDLKPDNIMLRPEPAGALPFQPVITDLGLARLAEADPITQAGALMGTPAYMSPEQALGQPTDARSDVYSLGVLLYEMSVGQTPFPVRDLAAAAQHHLHESPPAPGALRPGFPPALETVILTALSKTPEQRYPDAGVFAEALAALPPEALHAAETTFAPGEAVSLTTVLRSSTPAEGRGASIFQVFPTRLAGLAQDQVRVLRPDGTTSAVALPTGGLTLGRAADNGLALTGPHVSARHARIDFDGARYVVTDLNSTNGTYLGPVKLLPGVPEPWTPDRPLKVGDFYLRLELAAAPVPTAVGGSIVRSGNGRFSVTVAPAQLTVTPGGRAAAAVTVLNESDIVDHYALTVTGLPAAWASLEPRLRLMPGESHELRLTLALPRSPQARAGRHPFVVRVASEVAPDEVAEVRAAAMVAAYLEFEGRLRPARVRSGQPAAVWVANHGNAPAVFTLRFDEDGNLAFTPAAPSLRIEPGDSAAAEFRARPRRPRWIGPEAAHPFRALVSAEGAEPQALSGQLISRPPIPPWLPPVMFALCLLAGGGAWWASGWGKPPPPPATALTVTLVAPAATVDSPLLAATATALWLAADTDGDGLSNVMEVTVGTRPEAADTDGDGIDDNDEITLGRDPLQPEGVAAVTLPPTATPTPLVAAVAEATTATATPTSTSSATATAAATAASTGAPTATHLTPTSTFSPIPTSTRTPTSTHTPTPTGTATPTLTVTPTPTWTPTLPPLTGNLAPGASRSPDSIGSGNAFDGNLSTFWNITHRFTVTFSWGRTAVVERLLVWDRPQNSPDNNQINVLQVRLSNGLLKQFDMDSGGRRCIDIAVQPPQSITSVELTAWDASGGNGMSELEIWAGPKTTAITCANSGVLP